MRLKARTTGSARRWLGKVDAFFNRLYGWRSNPVYHSGALAVAAFLVLLVTGVYLLLFYRIGSPWQSVAGLQEQGWGGRWIRALHRYASDLTVAAVLLHAVRMFLQRRTWGSRALAWVSGLVLFLVVLACGWTGLVMVWDEPALVLAREGARLIDVIPVFSEPLERTFAGERAIPAAFFFLNLFLHIALPVGVAMILWLHVSRVARPSLLPPARLLWGSVALLCAAAVLAPAPLSSEADVFAIPPRVPIDAFYAFFLPLTRPLPVPAVWGMLGAVALLLLLVPRLSRPGRGDRPAPSRVNERLCTGCRQCALDCPYEAIAMVPRRGERDGLVARVAADLCVSCGICAGSCAPMGVGPAGRTGRDQLEGVKAFIAERTPGPGDVVLVACEQGAGGAAKRTEFRGAPVLSVACAGSLHTSVVEYLVRAGAGGVMVASCPPRDCRNREGPRWLEARMYHDREAELRERVDRRRVRLQFASLGEEEELEEALARFRSEVRALDGREGEGQIVLETECEREQPDGAAPLRIAP
ncbi:MAG: hydrogenase iron-sulfur subunit [Gemmatimonadota bacterium]|jgi:coenzyme F420-reducing hydrogenase delta subunit/Pyruvate/2-oxoacid:ferredoxin oxidoreductase delta subunit